MYLIHPFHLVPFTFSPFSLFHLVIEPPRDAHFHIPALHGVERCGQIFEIEHSRQQIAATYIKGNTLYAQGEIQVEIQIVAHLLIIFVIELVHQRIVGVSVIQRVVHQVAANLDMKTISENFELVGSI